MTHRFDELDLAALRRRRSVKWAAYPDDVLPVWVAEMDFPLADPVKAALRAAVDRDDCGYAYGDRIGEAFAGWARAAQQWVVDPAQVRVFADVMSAAAEVLQILTGPGDAVVINPPVYPPFFSTVAEIDRRIVEAPLARGEDGGYRLDLAAVEARLAEGARAYLLCNPHNPSGRVFSRDDLEQVAALARRYDAVVIADEIHGPLTLPGARHTPYVTVDPERGITLTSASKAWNLAGLKCAVTVTASERMREVVARVPEEASFHTGLFGVLGAEAAFRSGGGWLDEVVSYLDGNRRLVGELVADRLPGVRYVPPEASYLAWLDCRALGLGDDPAAVFLERGRVALNSGGEFGTQGRGFARLNMGTSRALLGEAVDRMASALEGVRR